MSRRGKVTRKTAESEITVEINLDGTGKSQINTCLLYTSDAADDAPRV